MKAILFAVLQLSIFSSWANASGLPSELLDRPLLIQALDSSGKVKSSSFDIITSKPAADGTLRVLSPDINVQSWMGACFSLNANTCSRPFNFATEFPLIYAHAFGLLKAPAGMFDNLPTFSINYLTTIENISGNTVVVSIKSTFSEQADRYSLSVAPAFLNKVVKFELPSAELANRHPISEVDARLKPLTSSVFQILMSNDDSSLGGTSMDKGTGFFISPDGYFLTNNHVISGQPECLRVQQCKLKTMRTSSDGTRSYVVLDVQVLATDTGYDFALLKAKLPANSTVDFIKLEKTNIGPDLMTLGYPGDKTDEVDGQNVDRLTYSFGKLMGFHSKAYITSLYIYAGASGSPILNYDTLSLVALNSNGASAMGPEGAPAIGQSIQEIDRVFGIYKYLSGDKQRIVDGIIHDLSLTSTFDGASLLLDRYVAEKTLYGRARLKMLMTNLDSREVRRAILQKLNLD